jgi:steroid delta-isomerase-like uncharacterized protein
MLRTTSTFPVLLSCFLAGCGLSRDRMLEENKQIVLRAHAEVWSLGDMVAAEELYDQRFRYRNSRGEDSVGIEELRKSVLDQRTAFPDWQEQVEQVVAEGDLVVTRFIATGTHEGLWRGRAPTRKKLRIQEIAIHRVANGKIVEQWTNGDWDLAPEQLGFVEDRAPEQRGFGGGKK